MIRGLFEGVQGYPGLFLLCATAGILQPFPQDITLAYAGIRLDQGEFAWGTTLVVATLGVLTRDVAMYWIGRLVGDWLLTRRWLARFLPPARVQKARDLVARRGALAVLLGRFLVGVRATVFLVAGISGMSFARFVFWDVVGALITVPLGIGAGYWFGPPLVEGALWVLERFRPAVTVLVATAVLVVLVRAVVLHRRGEGD